MLVVVSWYDGERKRLITRLEWQRIVSWRQRAKKGIMLRGGRPRKFPDYTAAENRAFTNFIHSRRKSVKARVQREARRDRRIYLLHRPRRDGCELEGVTLVVRAKDARGAREIASDYFRVPGGDKTWFDTCRTSCHVLDALTGKKVKSGVLVCAWEDFPE